MKIHNRDDSRSFTKFSNINDKKFKENKLKKAKIFKKDADTTELEAQHKQVDIMLDNDELSPEEAGFLQGYLRG